MGWWARRSSSQAAAAGAAVVVFARKTKKSAAAAVAAAEVAAGRTQQQQEGPYLSRPDQSCNRSVYTHFHKIWGLPPAPSSTPTLLTPLHLPRYFVSTYPDFRSFFLSFVLSCFAFLCFLSWSTKKFCIIRVNHDQESRRTDEKEAALQPWPTLMISFFSIFFLFLASRFITMYSNCISAPSLCYTRSWSRQQQQRRVVLAVAVADNRLDSRFAKPSSSPAAAAPGLACCCSSR